MADRYWVGGTDSWDGTAGSKWAATSGGAGGESVPTTADDVFFDANSSGTVTIAAGNTGAKSINCTGFTGGIAGSANITVAGSITLDAGQTYTHTGAVIITGTGTLATAGKTFSGVTVNGSGITVTLGDALNTGPRNLILTEGTFDTANFNVTTDAFTTFGSSTRVVSLGSSNVIVTGTGGCNFTGTNITVNAGTSTIQGTVTPFTFNGGGNTFYDVSNTANTSGNFTVLGANTFNNLTISGSGGKTLLLGDNQTVNGTFVSAGANFSSHILVFSNTIGTTRTITAAAVSADDCDFRDITIAGAAAPISPARAGDCGGNSGITFPAAKTVYRVGTNPNWAGSDSWALTSGGTGSNDNFPLAQDTVVIDDNTTKTSVAGTRISLGNLDTTTRTSAFNINNVGSFDAIYGNWLTGSGISYPSGGSALVFQGRSTQIFGLAGKQWPNTRITIDCLGTVRLNDAFTSSGDIIHTRGDFDANNYNVTCTNFSSNNSNTRTITMGSGLWTLTGTGAVWNTGTSTNLTFNKDTADLLLSNTTTTARSFSGGNLSYNKLTIGGATGTSVLTLSGSNSTITDIASTKTVAHTITINANNMTIDTWSVTGTSGNVVTVNSSSAGGRRTINLTNATSGIDFLDVKDIGITDPDKFYVGDNSIDSGNNLNVIFTAAPSPGLLVPVTGVATTGQVGTAVAVGTAVVPVTGAAATGQVGTAVAVGTAIATATGAATAGQVGDVVVITASVTAVPVTGVTATGQVGAAAVTGEAAVTPTGVAATGQVGAAAVSQPVSVPLTGVTATGQVGAVIIPNVGVSVTGVAATGAVGNVIAFASVVADATGVAATGQVGTVDVGASAQIIPFGVSAAGQVGQVGATGTAVVPVTGVEATGQVGTAQAVPSIEVPVTGAAASGQVGAVVAAAGADVAVVGVSATGRAGQVIVWGPVSPDPGNQWTDVDPSVISNWTPVAA